MELDRREAERPRSVVQNTGAAAAAAAAADDGGYGRDWDKLEVRGRGGAGRTIYSFTFYGNRSTLVPNIKVSSFVHGM